MFKVYNGPMPAPKCKEEKCQEQICVWMSDRLCFRHAKISVMIFDVSKLEKPKPQNENR